MLCSATIPILLALGVMAEESKVEIKTQSGTNFVAMVGMPEGEGPFPAVVIAPGRGYHMELPLVKDLAERLRSVGIATVRFDWIFFTKKESPSEGRKTEQDQIESALDHLKTNGRIDKNRLGIVGKSLGSVVAWSAFRNRSDAKAVVMLTPIMPDEETALRLHPGLEVEHRDAVWIIGDNDAENCSLPVIYKIAGIAKAKSRVVVLEGGHSFERSREDSAPENSKFAIEAASYWFQRLL